MRNPGEGQFERMLREHLAAELDGQLGRSLDRFRSEIAAPRRPQRRWIWRSVGVAMAASLFGILLLGPLGLLEPADHTSLHVPDSPEMPSAPQDALRQLPDFARSISARVFDEGTLVVDGQYPVRRLRRKTMETVEWFDPSQQARIQLRLPREQVVLVGLQTY